MVEPGATRALKVLFLTPAAQGNERHVLKLGMMANPAGYFVTIHTREVGQVSFRLWDGAEAGSATGEALRQ